MEQRKMKRRIQAYLWEFLVGLLEDKECAPFINWTNKFEKEFVVVDPDEVASLWGLLKNRPKMNKTKLRRAIRQYYKRDLIMKVKGRVGVYKFLQLPYDPISWEDCEDNKQILYFDKADDDGGGGGVPSPTSSTEQMDATSSCESD